MLYILSEKVKFTLSLQVRNCLSFVFEMREMILIADSGSTKCDWILANGTENHEFKTMGFNPFFHDEKLIVEKIRAQEKMVQNSDAISEVYFYGAGCHNANLQQVVSRALKNVFPRSQISVDHDLAGAAYATCGGQPGIACILGTGSNSCYFDGDNIHEEVPALAYILGDEGSGSYFGKKLLSLYLYKKLPEKLHKELRDNYKLTKDVIFENVYQKPHANVYLASFMKVLSENKNESFVQKMIFDGMTDFLKTHVCCFKTHREIPVHFVGSVAYYFEEILKSAAASLSITVGNIVKKPIHNLAEYHLSHL